MQTAASTGAGCRGSAAKARQRRTSSQPAPSSTGSKTKMPGSKSHASKFEDRLGSGSLNSCR